jgi:hypothetical protein
MKIELTGAEKVLFKATFEFATKALKVSEAEATEMAMNKIISKRALVKKIDKSGYKF